MLNVESVWGAVAAAEIVLQPMMAAYDSVSGFHRRDVCLETSRGRRL